MSIVITRDSLGTRSLMTSRRASACTVLSQDDRAEDLTNNELVVAADSIKRNNYQLVLENQLFESFLQRLDPSFNAGYEQLITQATNAAAAQNRAHTVTSLTVRPITTSVSMTNLSVRRGTDDSLTSPRTISRDRSPSVMRFGTSLLQKDTRMNIGHKMDMTSRELEELRISSEATKKERRNKMNGLKVRILGLHLAIRDITETANEFRNTVIAEKNSKIRKISAEGFIQYMEEWLHKEDIKAEKLRFKTSMLHSLNLRRQRELKQLIDQGRAVHSVDCKQLEIENKELVEKMKKRNHDVTTLKKIHGNYSIQGQKLNCHFQEQVAHLDSLQEKCEKTGDQILRAKERGAKARGEVDGEIARLRVIRELKNNYKAPSVSEYFKKKSEVENLKKELRIWSRRNDIQHKSLVSSTYALHKITMAMASNPSEYPRKQTVNDPNTNITPPPPSRQE